MADGSDGDSYTGGDDSSNYGNEGGNYGTGGLNASTDGIFGGISDGSLGGTDSNFSLDGILDAVAENYNGGELSNLSGLGWGDSPNYGDPFGITDNFSVTPQETENAFWGRAKSYAMNKGIGWGKGQAAQALGLQGLFGMPAINAGIAAFNAPYGQKGEAALNKGFESILDSTLFAMPNMFNGIANTITGQNNPSVMAGLMSQGGYKGGDGYADSFSEANMNSPNGGFDWLGLAGGLGGLYSMYNQNQNNSNYMKDLGSMYGQNSPYAQQLRQQLARKDAAAGRRSQYGPREVELQAKLAQMQTQLAPSMMQGRQNNFDNYMKMFQQAGAMNKAGLFDGLKGMFKSDPTYFQMPQTPYADTNYNGPSQNYFSDGTPSFSDQSLMPVDPFGASNMNFDFSLDW